MIDAAYAIRHHVWATRRLLEYAQGLSPAQRALTVPGTAGSLNFCLAHVVGADQRYLRGLGAEIEPPFWEAEDSDLADMLAAHAAGERAWERFLAAPPDLDGWFARPDSRVRRIVLPAQAIHHGTDHRTQVGTILLHHGLELPAVAVWAYAREAGDFVELSGPDAV